MGGHTTEGTMEWEAGRTWFRLVDEQHRDGRTPLVILHGGPGAPHDYLEPLSALAQQGSRACLFYDQIGCGRSQHMPDAPPDFWSVDLFCRELSVLLEHVGFAERYHLLGQSWGGMLAMEHAITRPAGLRSLVIANSPASIALWVDEANRLRGLLPNEVQETLRKHEAAGTTASDEYEQAMMSFYERHLCRVVPFPEPLQRTFAQVGQDPTVYHTMNGPSEFHVIGTLRSWDITPRLGEIRVPALVISGEHDEATPAVVRPLVEALPDARWELFAGASHSTHLEQPERFLQLVARFLDEHD
jgi:L-proline amide hydrolase